MSVLTPPWLAAARQIRGSADHPLLAPRGVWLAGGRLFVSDTAQNRVFVWHRAHEADQCAPDVVLGQPDDAHTGRNAGGAVGADTLHYPSGVWSDGRRLAVADAWNHRVLLWHTLPTRSGQPADVVLGQPDFAHNQPNVAGLAQPPTARSLYWCYGVCSDGQRLWVADTGNRRVLWYDRWPETSYAPADGVVGQAEFDTRHYDPQHAIWPYSVKVGTGRQLAITDTQYYRVLLWQNGLRAAQQPADYLVGQPDFDTNGQNQFLPRPAAHTLSWCYDSCFVEDGLWVADTGNSRLLGFDQVPIVQNPAADRVLGKPDFATGSENADTKTGTQHTLYWPFALVHEGHLLAVADTGNHRVLLLDLPTQTL